jgi:hypothetical protein
MYHIFFGVIGFRGRGGCTVLRIHINIEDKWLHCKSEAFGKHFYQVYGTLQSALVPCPRNIIKKA